MFRTFIPIVVVGVSLLGLRWLQELQEKTVLKSPILDAKSQIYWYGWRIKMMIPVLAAYIAYSFGRKACSGAWFVFWLPGKQSCSVGESRFLLASKAMVLGVAAGYLVQWMKSWKVNNYPYHHANSDYPKFVFTRLLACSTHVLAAPLGAFMDWLDQPAFKPSGWFCAVLGIVFGLMTAFLIWALASYLTMALMTAGVYSPNGAFRAAAAGLLHWSAVLLLIARSKLDDTDRQMGISCSLHGT